MLFEKSFDVENSKTNGSKESLTLHIDYAKCLFFM